MIGMKKLLIAVPFLALVTLVRPANASAGSCDLTDKYKTFADSVQNGQGSDIQRELSARRELLSATIDCAKADLYDLKDQVSADENDKTATVRERVLDSIDEGIRFLDIRRVTLGDQGIQGTKDIARDIKGWRDNNLQILSDRVKNFLFWSGNQPLFEKASDRLSQSQLVVTSLKILENEDAQKVYFDAKTKLDNALSLNNKAGDAIARGISSDETLGLIKDSLGALSDTYKNFFDISDKLNGPSDNSGNK